eukprot:2268330-Rhodomonas_salina.1
MTPAHWQKPQAQSVEYLGAACSRRTQATVGTSESATQAEKRHGWSEDHPTHHPRRRVRSDHAG